MATWLLSPLAWLLMAIALATAAQLSRRHRRWLLWPASGLAMIAIAAMTPLGANTLLAPLERSVAAPAECARPTNVAIVLGGGLEGWPHDEGDYRALNLSARRRLDRAVAWWRKDEARSLVVQGGGPYPGAISIGHLMARYASALGVPASAVRVEAESSDTWENAQRAAAMVPALPRRVVLVTSRVHMPRARAAFARAGFVTCPEGTDSRRMPSRLPWALFPRTSALATSDLAIHEWAGLAWYHWRADGMPSQKEEPRSKPGL